MLNQHLANNHKYIRQCARNICRVKNELMADDLISEAYLIAARKTAPEVESEFISWYVTIMHNLFRGKRSKFNKIYNGKEIELNDYVQVTDSQSLEEIYLACEQSNEVTNELVNELSHLTKEKINKYVDILEFKESLPGWDKEIFELHFELGMSSREIAKGTKLVSNEVNYQRINKLINKLKENINEWKSLTS